MLLALLVALPPIVANTSFAATDAIGFAKEERYDGHIRVDLEDPAFTATPDAVSYFPSFETPVNQLKAGVDFAFADRLSAVFTPATTGNYVFFVCSDDDSDLFLSTDDTPANKKLIAQETGWSNNRQWLTSGGNSDLTAKRSDQFATTEWPGGTTITLTAGKKYYIEGVRHEGGGGDDLSATFKLDTENDPADGTPTKLTGNLISTITPDLGIKINVNTQPANITVQQNQSVSVSVAVTATQTDGTTPTVYYQWQKQAPGATTFTDIPGATTSSYTSGLLSLSDSGTQFKVVMVSPGVSVASSAATITVVPDNTPPKVLSVGTLKNFANSNTEISVVFDEPLKDTATATALANYSLNTGTISAARYVTNSSGLDTTQSGVVLTATGITPGTGYTLTVKSVSDAHGNTLTTPTNVQFTAGNLTWISIGRTTELTPPSQPDALATSTNGFNLVSGGNAFWGTSDDITMVYEEVTGDFDKIARVEFSDAASNWARSGISARESLNNGAPTTDDAGDNSAGRYQMVIADPTTKFDGTAANNTYETNRRVNAGGATSSSNGGGTPAYPDAWLRLQRIGQRFNMYRSTNGVVWKLVGSSDFGDLSTDATPLPDKLFVGPTYGPENGNITDETLRKIWATRIRDYGNMPNKARGSADYSVGLNFDADEFATPGGAFLAPTQVAGVDAVAQANWNNLFGASSDAPTNSLVADVKGTSTPTTVTVEWASANAWASTGRGEENNQLPGADQALMTGYLDTGGATTSHATITAIPTQLTSGTGYDVYVYLLGGVDGDRGGGYRIVDSAGAVLKDYVLARCDANPTTFNPVPTNLAAGAYGVGNYIKFTGLTAASITIEATTENGLGVGAAPRAPLNAIQLVKGGAVVVSPTLSVARTATGITLTYTGTLQGADKVNGPYTDVPGATSPRDVLFSAGAAKFYRTKQ